MKQYIQNEEGGNELLFDVESQLGFLPVQSQKCIFKYVFEFIKREFSLSAKNNEIILICRAVIDLFASLKTENSVIGGIVSVFFSFVFSD